MSGEREIEVKLVTTAERLADLAAHPLFRGEVEQRTLTAHYYDSPDWRLRQGGARLRTRNVGTMHEQTLKLANGQGAIDRAEWNTPITDDQLDLDAFPKTARAHATRILGKAQLRQFATIETDRRMVAIHYQGAELEIAFDTARITANGHSERLTELELEVRQGRAADVLRLALELPLGDQLLWAATSKAERAYFLASGAVPSARKAAPVDLRPDMAASEAFQRIAWNCLDHLLANYRLVIDRRDAEAVHQSRVAIRRLRAACSIFSPIIADDKTGPLLAELKAAADTLGKARDLDVLIEAIRKQAEADALSEGLEELIAHLEQQRSDIYDHVTEMLTGASFQKMLLETALWIEDGNWLKQPGTMARQAEPISDYAAHELHRRQGKIAKALPKIAVLDPDQRHQLRIRIKKFRYATDFFSALADTPDRKARHKKLSSALSDLQDSLGELNDITTSRDTAVADFSTLDEISRARLAAMLEQSHLARAGDEKRLLKSAVKAGDQLIHTRRFWKKPAR